MKKLLVLLLLLVPGFAGAHVDDIDYGFHHMGFGMGGVGVLMWLMWVIWLVWLGVGILVFIWLLKKLMK